MFQVILFSVGTFYPHVGMLHKNQLELHSRSRQISQKSENGHDIKFPHTHLNYIYYKLQCSAMTLQNYNTSDYIELTQSSYLVYLSGENVPHVQQPGLEDKDR